MTRVKGPQVGNILLRNDAGEAMYGIPQMPVDICVADSQGGIGYMIERMLRNVLNKHNLHREIVTLVTLTMVDKNDPAFNNPTKRIGKLCTYEEAERLSKEKGWIFKEEMKTGNGFRRVVPSPEPLKIMNSGVIEYMARQGTIVIAAGGGGEEYRFTSTKRRCSSGRSGLSTRIWLHPFWLQAYVPANSIYSPTCRTCISIPPAR
jgi:carbamate kinase